MGIIKVSTHKVKRKRYKWKYHGIGNNIIEIKIKSIRFLWFQVLKICKLNVVLCIFCIMYLLFFSIFTCNCPFCLFKLSILFAVTVHSDWMKLSILKRKNGQFFKKNGHLQVYAVSTTISYRMDNSNKRFTSQSCFEYNS